MKLQNQILIQLTVRIKCAHIFKKAQSCIFVDQKLVSYILLAHEGTTIKRDFLACQMDYVRFTTIYFSRTKNFIGFFVVSCLCFMFFLCFAYFGRTSFKGWTALSIMWTGLLEGLTAVVVSAFHLMTMRKSQEAL